MNLEMLGSSLKSGIQRIALKNCATTKDFLIENQPNIYIMA